MPSKQWFDESVNEIDWILMINGLNADNLLTLIMGPLVIIYPE